MQRPLLAFIACATLVTAQKLECNPLADMRGCTAPERCEEVFVEGPLGEKIARVNASCHSMLDVAENRSRDAKMQAAMANKELWKRTAEVYPQVCRLRLNTTRMQLEARASPRSADGACDAVLAFPAAAYDLLADRMLGCFKNSTIELMESARRLEDELISGSLDRIEATAQMLEECIPAVDTCDLPDDEISAIVDCVSRREADKTLDQREKEVNVFGTHLVTIAGANYTMLVQRMHRCFASNMGEFVNATETLLDNHSDCTGTPRIRDEL